MILTGWQVDNEFGNPKCYCDSCRKVFQRWLKLKYKTLENLNQSWGSVFWSQDYTSWDQIPLYSRRIAVIHIWAKCWTADQPSSQFLLPRRVV